jgi:hypothetical protein
MGLFLTAICVPTVWMSSGQPRDGDDHLYIGVHVTLCLG